MLNVKSCRVLQASRLPNVDPIYRPVSRLSCPSYNVETASAMTDFLLLQQISTSSSKSIPALCHITKQCLALLQSAINLLLQCRGNSSRSASEPTQHLLKRLDETVTSGGISCKHCVSTTGSKISSDHYHSSTHTHTQAWLNRLSLRPRERHYLPRQHIYLPRPHVHKNRFSWHSN